MPGAPCSALRSCSKFWAPEWAHQVMTFLEKSVGDKLTRTASADRLREDAQMQPFFSEGIRVKAILRGSCMGSACRPQQGSSTVLTNAVPCLPYSVQCF